MQRAVAHYPSREIAVLGLVELLLSFAVLYTVIQAAGAPVLRPAVFDLLPRSAIGLAATLTLMTGSVALAAGLYRLDVCRNRKGLLTVAGLVSIIMLVVLLFVNKRSDSQADSGQDCSFPSCLLRGSLAWP